MFSIYVSRGRSNELELFHVSGDFRFPDLRPVADRLPEVRRDGAPLQGRDRGTSTGEEEQVDSLYLRSMANSSCLELLLDFDLNSTPTGFETIFC